MDGEITADELHELLEADADVRIVDIRDPGSFARGHIPGSDNIPFAQLPTRIEELRGADRIVTVCPIGQSSIQAARLIASFEGTHDTRVESLAEGITNWEYDIQMGSEGSSDDGSHTAPDEGPDAPF